MSKATSVGAFVLMVIGVAGLYGAGALFATHPAAIAVQVAAFLLMVAARITFGRRSFHAAANPTSGGVVSSGPYAYVRHPIYAAAMYFTWAGALNHLSWKSAAFALLLTVGALIRMTVEERMVTERYPEYAAYKARVSRIIPAVY